MSTYSIQKQFLKKRKLNMPTERYFIDEAITLNQNISLKGSEFHHLSRVMRGHCGDELELVNGKGILARGIVEKLTKEHAEISIKDIFQEQENAAKIILAQALPKTNRLDFILEKGTELGVDEFWLFPGELSIKKDFSENQKERAHTITIAAMKQCGRLSLPRIKILPVLSKWPDLAGVNFFGDLDPKAPVLLGLCKPELLKGPISFFVGPESGWHINEVKLLKEKGAVGVKLHQNILRTDTASLVAISLIQHQLLLYTQTV